MICTFNRLPLLRDTVASCLHRATQRGLQFEIVIADNSPCGYARDLAAEFAATGAPVLWTHALPPNISVARNAGLSAAQAPLVAFLDDDVVVEPGWLDYMHDAMCHSGADVVLCGLRPQFMAGRAPAWDPQGSRFTRNLELASGTPFRAGKGKPRGFVVSTASSLWRRSTCFTDTALFDPAFGASGGEDLDLFLRLERRGRRFAWCRETVVWETVPPGRTAVRYQAMRSFSGGQAFVGATVNNVADPGRQAATHMVRGLVQILMNGALMVLDLPLLVLRPADGRARVVRHFLDAALAAGKVFWWHRIPLYRAEKPAFADACSAPRQARVTDDH